MPASPWSVAVRANVSLAPGEQKDAFGRLRTSQPTELFSKALEYDAQPLFYENVVTEGASASYNSPMSSVDLTISAVGAKAIRQSRQYVRYRPGKSQQIFVTGNFQGQETGVIKRIGYYDDDTQTESTGDGLFFEVSDTGIYVVRRSSTSGVSTDFSVEQSDWNVDKLDGTGPSGQTLDINDFCICVFEFGWLGGATIRWGLLIGGQVVIVHEEFPSNTLSSPFMRHPSLPVRWEIIGYAGVATGSMRATCASVQSEGGFNTLGVRRAASRGDTGLTLAATTLRPLISIRLNSPYTRALLEPASFSVLADGTTSHEILIITNGVLTGATFTGTSGIAQFDTAATAITAGSVIHTQYAQGGSSGPFSIKFAVSSILESDVPLAATYAGVCDIMTLAVRPLTTSSTVFYGSLDWREFY